MSPGWANVLIGIVTFIASTGISAFIAGVGWGGIRKEMSDVNSRLAKIEGMFVMKLKE